jgi:hypothetical protein
MTDSPIFTMTVTRELADYRIHCEQDGDTLLVIAAIAEALKEIAGAGGVDTTPHKQIKEWEN